MTTSVASGRAHAAPEIGVLREPGAADPNAETRPDTSDPTKAAWAFPERFP